MRGLDVPFVAMNNVFEGEVPQTGAISLGRRYELKQRQGWIIHEKFDLKGSTVGRYATEEQKAKPNCILKVKKKQKKTVISLIQRFFVVVVVEEECEVLIVQTIINFFMLCHQDLDIGNRKIRISSDLTQLLAHQIDSDCQ